jgi:hypothetical protein
MAAAKVALLPRAAVDGTRAALQANAPLDSTLHVVTCVSNPCGYRRRWQLARRFLRRMEAERHVRLYVVELAYGDQDFFSLAEAGHPRHLRLRSARAPLWHKENLINAAVRTLLPSDWRAMAWIDADVAFQSDSWALDALRLLNGSYDVLQLFSHAEDLGPDGVPMKVFTGFGREHLRAGAPPEARQGERWHPGFAWAWTRATFERAGGLFQEGVLGSGDTYMAMSFLGLAKEAVQEGMSDDYLASVLAFQERVAGLRLGYVPGVLSHAYHGSKKKRGYGDRWCVLVKWQFSPRLHLQARADDGLLEPSAACPAGFLEDVLAYFGSRDEDEHLSSSDEEES